MSHYSRGALAEALEAAGARRGDVVFSHSNVGFFGRPEEGRTPEDVFRVVLGAFEDVLGPSGTLVVPAFTYSYPRLEVFDRQASPSTCGMFTEMLRNYPGSHRSDDPMLSVVAWGRQAEEMTRAAPQDCFARDGFWGRFLEVGGLICNLNFDAGSTFIHYVERQLQVPYRYDKLFRGFCRGEDGQERQGSCIFFSRDLADASTLTEFEDFDRYATGLGVVARARVGRGNVLGIRARDTFAAVERGLQEYPRLLIAGPDKTLAWTPPAEPSAEVRLSERAELASELGALPRYPVSAGSTATAQALCQALDLRLQTFPTGIKTSSGVVPEAWECESAILSAEGEEPLADFSVDPYSVVPYSRGVDTLVDLSQLASHLHPGWPGPASDAIPPWRGWAFVVPQGRLTTGQVYRAVIRSSCRRSALCLAEAVIASEPGREPETRVWIPLDQPGSLLLAVGVALTQRLRAHPPPGGCRVTFGPSLFGAELATRDGVRTTLCLESIASEQPQVREAAGAGLDASSFFARRGPCVVLGVPAASTDGASELGRRAFELVHRGRQHPL